MKIAYILIILLVAASTLGCVGNKKAEPATSAPIAPVETSVSPVVTIAPVETSVSPVATIVPGSEDPFGTDADVAALDSMLADSTLDISLMDSI
jgi:hypothetical protein